eukprot:CAMPEP_0181042750 /NCGR_PEP_ID=MMETSP1070-20121207/12324_1 /TAXON_ID=265543 /ORGANISM="Minutocellus polymorphus, Strain NH13" /LENGTH=213 /DNA_ID=CAMNT_0023120999 /DNA_START=241 /DNA_END=882 /DNA_ORIENTATION=+
MTTTTTIATMMAPRRQTFPPATSVSPHQRRRPHLRRQTSRRNLFQTREEQETEESSESESEEEIGSVPGSTQSAPADLCACDSDEETVKQGNLDPLVPLNDTAGTGKSSTAHKFHSSFSSTSDGSMSDLSTLLAVDGQRQSQSGEDLAMEEVVDVLEISFRTKSKTNSRRRLSPSEVELFLDGGADVAVPQQQQQRGKLSRSARKNSRAARTA